jgi:DNA-binding transcriptional LysR family regulator
MEALLLDEMVVFARVVEQRGFAPAARTLGLTTSAVSRSVARLEAALGLKLLHRTTRAVSLTEDGAEVYPGCARLLQTAREVQSLAGRFASTPRGKLRVSAPPVFGELWLAPKLPAFFARWPEVEIELVLIDRVVDLVDEGFDLALRIVAPDALAPGLVARRLGDMGYVLVAAPGYLQRRGTPAAPAELAAHACIWLGYGAFGERLQMQRDGEDPVDVQLAGPLTVNNSAAILATVEAGLGIGLVPDFAAAAGLRDGRLERVLSDWRLAGGYATRGVHAVYAPTRHLPRKVRALIDHLADGGAEAAMMRP